MVLLIIEVRYLCVVQTVIKGLTMLEEDEPSANHIDDSAVSPDTSTGDSGAGVPQSSDSSRETSLGSNGVVRRGSLTDDSGIPVSTSTDVSLRAASVDLRSEDPWLPLSTQIRNLSPVHIRGACAVASGSHLECCNGASMCTTPHAAAKHDAQNLRSERFAASSNLQTHCDDKLLRKVRTEDVDRVLNSDAGLQHNLTEIKEGVPVECFDGARDEVTGPSHTSTANSVRHSSRHSNSEYVPNITANTICYSQLPSCGSRPARKGSLNGFRKAVRSVLVHRTSLISDHPAGLVDTDLCRSPVGSSASEYFSDRSGVPGSTEKSGGSAGTKRKVDVHHYFGSVRRSLRGGVAVDSVRHSLTHLLRAVDHGSSAVGERMAAACPERPVSSTLTLVGSRRAPRPVLSGLFGDVDAAESFSLQTELSRTSSGTDVQSDNESDGLSSTTTHLSELDTSDSFYESRLFDALEAPQNSNGGGGGGGGFDTDSSDDGTYSADSFSDLAPSDDQPASTASSDVSAEVDGSEPRQSDPAETDRSERSERRASAADVLRPMARQRSGSDVEFRENRRTFAALWQLGRINHVTDSSLSQQRWKRLSL